MQDYPGYNDFEEQQASKKARQFEDQLRQKRYLFIDLIQVEEIFEYYWQKNELSKARDLIHFAIQTYPTTGDLYFKLARIDYELGKFEDSLENVDIALEQNPFDREYVLFKSDLQARLEDYEGALYSLQELMALTDNHEEIYLQMGNIAQICGYPIESESFYKMALSLNPYFEEALYELAFLFESEDNLEGAIQIYENFLDEFPYTEQIWYHLGVLHRKNNNYEKALEAFDYAILINDSLHLAYFNKGQVWVELGNYPEAIRAFLEANLI
ncbi:MAG: tetratricopeptide repeat protein, partial [Bacteroidetes bacterium]|nr:tetratricopeptide repeat protein [Bacteroidota bacterium]